jgi:P-type conjugative transfer protein TrbJ
MRRVVLVLMFGLLAWGRGVEAQFAVFDPTNYAENVLHYTKAIEELRAAQAQIANQVQALKKLAAPAWRSVGGTVGQSSAAMATPDGIGYAAQDPGAALRATYPGVTATRTYTADERAQATRTLATLAAAIDGAHAQGTTFGPAVEQVGEFKRQTAGVTGHEQAIELSSSVGVFSAEELLLMRQALAAQSAMQAVYYAREVNSQAQAEENASSVLAVMASPAARRPPFSLRPSP